MKRAGAQAIDWDLERNYKEILTDIHCLEGKHIYVWIERNTISQISSDCGRASDVIPFIFPLQLNNLGSGVCVQDAEHCVPESNHWCSEAGLRNIISCLFALIRWEDESWSAMKRKGSDQLCTYTDAQTHTHTCDSRTIWLFPASAPSLCSHPFFTDALHLISVDPCLPCSHTTASPVKRRDCCEWTGPSSALRW